MRHSTINYEFRVFDIAGSTEISTVPVDSIDRVGERKARGVKVNPNRITSIPLVDELNLQEKRN